MTDGEKAVRLHGIPLLTYKHRTETPLQRIKANSFRLENTIFCVA